MSIYQLIRLGYLPTIKTFNIGQNVKEPFSRYQIYHDYYLCDSNDVFNHEMIHHPDFKLYEIQNLGDLGDPIVINEHYTYFKTNSFKVIRQIVDQEELNSIIGIKTIGKNGSFIITNSKNKSIEYSVDKYNNLICKKMLDGNWYYYNYNENGKETFAATNDYWIKTNYDEKNNKIYEETSSHDQYYYEYNDQNKLIRSYTNDEFWTKYHYNQDSYIIEYPNDMFITYRYDKNHNLISHEVGNDSVINYQYDDNNNQIYCQRKSKNKTEWFKCAYDDFNNLIKYSSSDGYWFEKSYDKNNNEILFKNKSGSFIEKEYNEDGYLIKESNKNGLLIKWNFNQDKKISNVDCIYTHSLK